MGNWADLVLMNGPGRSEAIDPLAIAARLGPLGVPPEVRVGPRITSGSFVAELFEAEGLWLYSTKGSCSASSPAPHVRRILSSLRRRWPSVVELQNDEFMFAVLFHHHDAAPDALVLRRMERRLERIGFSFDLEHEGA